MIAEHIVGDTFWKQVALNAVGPIIAALLGGLVVGFLIQWAQGRRERQQLRSALSFDMMRTAYSFYWPLIEAVRKEYYSEGVFRGPGGRRLSIVRSTARQPRSDLNDFADHYKEFRIAARVIEEQLRVNFPDANVRWLWHGVVDMLSARYFRLVHIPERFNDMAKVHGEHTVDPEIPRDTQKLFMTLAQYQDEKSVDAELLRRFEAFLNEAIRVALKLRIDPPSGAAVLRPGRGPLGPGQAFRTSGTVS